MKARRPVEIKGSALPVLRVVVRDCDSGTLDGELSIALANARPLLADALAVLDLRERSGDDIAPGEILGAARSAGVQLAAVLVGANGERAQLADSGLPIIEAPLPAPARAAPAVCEDPEPAESQDRPAKHSAVRSPPAPLYVTHPLRSGQRLYAQGRDLVVLAPTSRGSELIADGSIYAFVLLRGRALAGAAGDKSARIIATQLDAELVAISGVYRTLEAADLEGLGRGAVSVALTSDDQGGERLVLRAVSSLV
jgi:septum site-determining protein MinC